MPKDAGLGRKLTFNIAHLRLVSGAFLSPRHVPVARLAALPSRVSPVSCVHLALLHVHVRFNSWELADSV